MHPKAEPVSGKAFGAADTKIYVCGAVQGTPGTAHLHEERGECPARSPGNGGFGADVRVSHVPASVLRSNTRLNVKSDG